MGLAYKQIKAAIVLFRGEPSGIAAHRPQPPSNTVQQPKTNKSVHFCSRLRFVNRACNLSTFCRIAPPNSTAPQQSQPLQSALPADIFAGWRSGPQDPAGATVSIYSCGCTFCLCSALYTPLADQDNPSRYTCRSDLQCV